MAVSKDDIFEAANALLADLDVVPGKITIAQVRERLGGTGSQPTIAKYLREWKAAQNTESPLPALVSATGTDFIEQIWKSAKEEAEKEFHEHRRQMASQAEEMQSLLEQSEACQDELEKSLSAAHTTADRAQIEVDQLTEETNRLAADLSDSLKSKGELAGRNEQLVAEVATLETQLLEREHAHAREISLLERMVRGSQDVPAREMTIEQRLELKDMGSLEVPEVNLAKYPSITPKTISGIRKKAKDVLNDIHRDMTDDEKEDLKRDGFTMQPVYLMWDRDDEIPKGTATFLAGEGSDCTGNVPIVGDEAKDVVSVERAAVAALAVWLDDAQ